MRTGSPTGLAVKFAVLADIHANIAALEAVLAEVRAEGIGHLVLLGDMVGYYYEPRAVIEALSAFDCTAIRGNHDAMALDARGDAAILDTYRTRYGSGLDAVFAQFGEAEWRWLERLEDQRDVNLWEHRIRLAHGAPFDPEAPVYPDADAGRMARVVEGFDGDAVWLGHTHWPFYRAGLPAILNPGSVGQPRDIGGIASWAIFHAGTGAIAFRRTEFVVDALVAECRRRDPDCPRIAEVLVRRRLTVGA